MTTQIAIAMYPGLTLLDVVGPYQVFTLVPDVEVVVCAAERGRLSDDNGLIHIDVEHTFDDVTAPDVVLVGGGFGNRALLQDGSPIVEWIRAADEHTTWTTSVCTGSLLLGAAGRLHGRTATTHWHYADQLEELGATYSSDRVVIDGKYITGAGVSAGIDLALQLTAILAGDDIARAVQLGIEYDPQPPFDAGSPAKAGPELVELVAAVSDLAAAQQVSA